jgi:tetratricopeptide (TPR) repeat protein
MQGRSAPRINRQIDRLFAEALALQQRGLLGDAAARHQAILRKHPRHFGALQLLGIIRSQQGQHDRAIALLQRAVAQDSRAEEAHNNLGMALHADARYEEAVAAFDEAIAIRPSYAIAHNNRGNSLASLGRHDEAVAALDRAVALDSNYAEAFNNLGTALFALKRYQDAIAPFERALAVRPAFIEARMNLGNALAALKRHDEAFVCYAAYFEAALAKSPTEPALHVDFGKALQAAGRYGAAVAHYRQACVLQPDLVTAHLHLGSALQQVGRIDEAQRCFETAIAVDPRYIAAYLALIPLRKTTAGDPYLAKLETLAQDLAALDLSDRVHLHFALGGALADIGEHQRAFQHLLAGNAHHRQRIAYDEAQVLGRFEHTRNIFTADLVRSSGSDLSDDIPIFIIGMPRSGSTLVEQILASHPRVFAAGEISDFGDVLRQFEAATAPLGFPECVPLLTPTQLRELAKSYLDRMRTLARNATTGNQPPARITDKALANFRYAGLIHLALPGARIIHTCRDAIDTCLSCFSTLFNTQPFTFDLGELGRYYRAYLETMAHWHRVLPADVILDVQYELLVADFEPQARRIIAHCRLEWDDACLSPHRAERPVKTASAVQVRRPVYRSAVGRWRPDEETLRPLIDALG